MRLLLTPGRIRSVIADARTEKDLEILLRAHKIRFSYDTSAGYTVLRIPARSGPFLVYRTCSRSAPFAVRPAGHGAAFPAALRLPVED